MFQDLLEWTTSVGTEPCYCRAQPLPGPPPPTVEWQNEILGFPQRVVSQIAGYPGNTT